VRVLFPVEVFYPSQAGGAANSVYWIAKFIAARGFEPTVIASDKGLAPEVPTNRWTEGEAGRVMYVRTASLTVPLGQTVRSLMHVRRADVVHVASLFYPTAFLTAFAATALGKKLLWSVRGELDPFTLTQHSKRRKAWVLWAIRSFAGRHPVFHSTCDEETGYIRDAFGPDTRIVQIPNFIELPEPVERSAGKYLLYIGRIHPKKGIDNLLRALAATEAFLQSGYVLKIAGKETPPYHQELRRLVTTLNLDSRVEFLGQVEGAAKQQLLADAFWTFMPSHTENFGLVVLESLAQATPVAASTGSPWQVLERERLGAWSDNSPEALSGVLERIFSMAPADYEAMRGRGRMFVETHYDMHRNIGTWIETYRAL
jgi:glycosyltransferase involved in cell wall biosynthesis